MLIVGPNPTIDRRVHVETLRPGTVSRSIRVDAVPGGKPINVARATRAQFGVAQAAGGRCEAAHGRIGRAELHLLLPEQGADTVRGGLGAEGIPLIEYPVPGEVRESIIVHEADGRTTVINGQGAHVPADVWARYTEAILLAVRPGQWAVVSGSFPPGVGDADIIDLLKGLRERGCKLAVDCGPSWLAAALPVRPALITPNLAEAEATLHRLEAAEPGSPADEPVEFGTDALPRADRAARGLRAHGADAVVVTLGSRGAYWLDARGSGWIEAPKVPVRSPVGAGDALLAAAVAHLEAGAQLPDAVRWGVATAASAIQSALPGGATPDNTAELYAQLEPHASD